VVRIETAAVRLLRIAVRIRVANAAASVVPAAPEAAGACATEAFADVPSDAGSDALEDAAGASDMPSEAEAPTAAAGWAPAAGTLALLVVAWRFSIPHPLSNDTVSTGVATASARTRHALVGPRRRVIIKEAPCPVEDVGRRGRATAGHITHPLDHRDGGSPGSTEPLAVGERNPSRDHARNG
jgi:hypothetical protein